MGSPRLNIEPLLKQLKSHVLLWIDTSAGTGTLHNLGSVTHTDVATFSPIEGSLIVGDSTPQWSTLQAGGQDTVLIMGATAPGWQGEIPLVALPTHVLASVGGLGGEHSVSGLTAGQVLRATGASSAAFQSLIATDLPSHVLANTSGLGAQHITSGLTAGQVLRATGASSAAFGAIVSGDLPGGGNPSGLIFGTLSAAGASTSYVATDATLALFDAFNPSTVTIDISSTPGTAGKASRRDHIHAPAATSNPGNAPWLLATNSSGGIEIQRLGIGVGPSASVNNTIVMANAGSIGVGDSGVTGRLIFRNLAPDVIEINSARLAINRATASTWIDIFSDDALATPMIRIEQDGAAGDAAIGASLTGGASWTWGINTGEGSRWGLSNAATLGSADPFFVETSGDATFQNALTVLGAFAVEANDAATVPQVTLQQAGSGDIGILWDASVDYVMGVEGGVFRIQRATVLGGVDEGIHVHTTGKVTIGRLLPSATAELQVGDHNTIGQSATAEEILAIHSDNNSSGSFVSIVGAAYQTSATTGGPQGIEAFVVMDHPSGAVNNAIGFVGHIEILNAGDTTKARGYIQSLIVNGGAGDIAEYSHYEASSIAIIDGPYTGTITDIYGFRIKGYPAGVTITRKWGFFQDGADPNALEGSLSVGDVAVRPPQGVIFADDYVDARGGFTTDGTDPGTNRLRIGDFGVALGGFHVGGTADPGTDNLDVDGALKVGTGGANPSAGQLAITGRIIESSPTHVKATRSSNFQLTTSVWANVPFNLELYDTDSMHTTGGSNTRITIKTAGTYLLTGQLRFLNNTSGDRGIAFWRDQLSGNDRWIGLTLTPATQGSADHYLNISVELPLVVNDYIELRGFQSSGGNLDIGSLGTSIPHFTAIRIA